MAPTTATRSPRAAPRSRIVRPSRLAARSISPNVSERSPRSTATRFGTDRAPLRKMSPTSSSVCAEACSRMEAMCYRSRSSSGEAGSCGPPPGSMTWPLTSGSGRRQGETEHLGSLSGPEVGVGVRGGDVTGRRVGDTEGYVSFSKFQSCGRRSGDPKRGRSLRRRVAQPSDTRAVPGPAPGRDRAGVRRQVLRLPRRRHVPLRRLRRRAVLVRGQVRLGDGVAELHRAHRRPGGRAAP